MFFPGLSHAVVFMSAPLRDVRSSPDDRFSSRLSLLPTSFSVQVYVDATQAQQERSRESAFWSGKGWWWLVTASSPFPRGIPHVNLRPAPILESCVVRAVCRERAEAALCRETGPVTGQLCVFWELWALGVHQPGPSGLRLLLPGEGDLRSGAVSDLLAKRSAHGLEGSHFSTSHLPLIQDDGLDGCKILPWRGH